MSLPPAYFDALYSGAEDPWGFRDRWYEERKRALTLAALPARRYRRALEPGCSIGVLSAALAQRCDVVVATDVSPAALERAAARVPATVELRRWALGGGAPPEGGFDLVVLSEMGYYLDLPDLGPALAQVVDVLETGGTLLACHWRHPVEDYPTSGDAVHAAITAGRGLQRLGGWSDEDVLVEVWEKADAPPPSVAAREGLG